MMHRPDASVSNAPAAALSLFRVEVAKIARIQSPDHLQKVRFFAKSEIIRNIYTI
jgi:hypothetical protein